MPSNYLVQTDVPILGRVPILGIDEAQAVFQAPSAEAALKSAIDRSPELLKAVFVASQSLYHDLASWHDSNESSISATALYRGIAYVLRAATRTVPFGLFTSTGFAEFGTFTDLQIGENRRQYVRIDADWISAFLGAGLSEADKASIRLRISGNILRRGSRVYLMTAEGADKSRPMSLAVTPVLELIEAVAQNGVKWLELRERLSECFQSTATEAEVVISKLFELSFLTVELDHTPSTDLATYALRSLQDSRESANDLQAIEQSLDAMNGAELDTVSLQYYAQLNALMRRLSPSERLPLQIDCAHDFDGCLGNRVLTDLDVLIEVVSRSSMRIELREYRKRFLERYDGSSEFVPLLDLVHPDFGTGIDPSIEYAERDAQTERLRLLSLFEVVRKAWTSGVTEIALTANEFEEVLPPILQASELADSLDVGFQIAARDAAAIGAGEYLLAPGTFTACAGGGRTGARFGHIFPDDYERLLSFAKRPDSSDEVWAELVDIPSIARAANVTTTRSWCDYRILDGLVSDDPGTITPSEIYVSFKDGRFVLYCPRLGKRLRCFQNHLLNPDLNQPVTRLLAYLTLDGTRPPRSFDWGELAQLPFLPRLRYGRTIFSLARWLLPKALLSPSAATDLDEWMEKWHMPSLVKLTVGDHRLPIDMRSAVGLEILRDQANRTSRGAATVHLQEFFPRPADCWLVDGNKNYTIEFVASAKVADPTPPQRSTTVFVKPQNEVDDWFYAKLYIGRGQMDLVLRDAVGPVFDEYIARFSHAIWFFVRYADPLPHLRIRIFWGTPERKRRCDRMFSERLCELGRLRIINDWQTLPFRPELARYGGPELLPDVLRLFSASSTSALADIRQNAEPTAESRAEACLASFVPIGHSILYDETLDAWFAEAKAQIDRKTPVNWPRIKRVCAAYGKHNQSPSMPNSRIRDALLAWPEPFRLGRFISDIFHMHANRYGLSHDAEETIFAEFQRCMQRHAFHSRHAPQQ